MARDVTVGLPMPFGVEAVVDFVLRPDVVDTWLGDGSRLVDREGGEVVVGARAGRVVAVRRTQSSFRLDIAWSTDGQSGADTGLTIRVTTCPGGRSRLRVTERGVQPAEVTERTSSWARALAGLGELIKLASDARRGYRQAVVVIHGIGEQRLNSSLRGFVSAVFPDSRHSKRFVKPDYLSPLVGASSVTVPGRWSINRPTTDVYELYWAHLLRDTTVGQFYGWALRLLLLTPAANISPKLRRHVYAVRTVLALVAVVAIAFAVAYMVGDGPRAWITALITGSAALLAVVPALVWKIAKVLGKPLEKLLVADVLGDAARYLDPSPANVQVRQAIRESGGELLDALHDRGRHSRIVVYGHSLGSVIAYDVVSHAWTRRSRDHANAELMRTPALRAVEDLLNPRDGDPAVTDIDDIRELQHAAWNEFTGNGFGWLVSDLVTAGSPLTHARMLLNPDKTTTFDQLAADRAMPTSPPLAGSTRSPRPGHRRRTFTYTHLYRGEGDSRPRSVLVPDHGALFALVRWTNVYFPHTGFIRGDPVGGPLRPTFGAWVDDIELPAPAGGMLGFAHTKYVDPSNGRTHVDVLREALELTVTPEIDFWLARGLSRLPD